MIVGAASGFYTVTTISAALWQACKNTADRPTMFTAKKDIQCGYCRKKGHVENDCFKKKRDQARKYTGRRAQGGPSNDSDGGMQVFYTYNTGAKDNCRALIDSGACGSVVGKETLDKAMNDLDLTSIENCTPKKEYHRFGNHAEQQKAICAVAFPFNCATDGNKFANFKVQFNVIAGNLSFVI